MRKNFPDPTWARLGFSEPPDFHNSGKNIGIVILDKLTPHDAISHLGSRIKYITVNEDLSIVSRNIAFDSPSELSDDSGEHGLMTVLSLTHQPFELQGKKYVGIAPAANYIVLDHAAFKDGEGERLKSGMDWIMSKQLEWNIKIILCMGWHAGDNQVRLKNTIENSTVQALDSAVKQGVLVICANGNTRLINILPPQSFFAVGGYNDLGNQNRAKHVAYPDEPYGRNSDGHFRPDVLAPRVYLTIPFCENNKEVSRVSYYWGTSGAATLVAGVAAFLFSKYPNLDADTLRSAFVEYGDPLIGYDNPAPRVNVAKIVNALNEGFLSKRMKNKCVSLQVKDPYISIHSDDDIERGLALSNLIQNQLYLRDALWDFTKDESPVIRKIAVSALGRPVDDLERRRFWNQLMEEKEGGVRGWYTYGLLTDAGKDEFTMWIPLATDINWSVRWCVSEYLAKFPDLYPQLEKTHDPDSVETKAFIILDWLNEHLI
ncbi:S8 family serine peptidase [Paenibacillus sp. NPDC057886]|uniref:S8 family serine peptidase n=1 Tax=Paenibacillus sp. NPDC057886 TaxID=3346270 RepID=UPI00367C3731